MHGEGERIRIGEEMLGNGITLIVLFTPLKTPDIDMLRIFTNRVIVDCIYSPSDLFPHFRSFNISNVTSRMACDVLIAFATTTHKIKRGKVEKGKMHLEL